MKAPHSWTAMVRHRFGETTPRSLGKLPYETALGTLRVALKMELKDACPELWARGDYLGDTFVPFISKLDLTLWFSSKPSPLHLLKISKTIASARHLFPILGNINLYVSSEAPHFFDLANLIEIRKDPNLWTRLGFGDREPDPNEQIVFWLRHLGSDNRAVFSSWQKQLRARAELVRIPLSGAKPTLSSALKDGVQTLTQFSETERQTIFHNLEEHFRTQEVEGSELIPSTYCRDRWTFFPHTYCLGNNPLPILNEARARIAFRQVAWEIWKLWTRFRMAENTYIPHVSERLRTFTESVLLPVLPLEGTSVLTSLKFLESAQKSWTSSQSLSKPR